jgi:hypothetical protein
MTISRRVVLIGAAIMALAAGSGGAIAFAQDDSTATPGTSESQGTSGDDSGTVSSEPAGDDSTVPTESTSDESGESSDSSESAGDDSTGSAEAPTPVVSSANFTG